MRELPILMNQPMVIALRNNQKTMTRRLIKLDGWDGDPLYETRDGDLVKVELMAPYQVGDHLYVRETWRVDACGVYGDKKFHAHVDYRAGWSQISHVLTAISEQKQALHYQKKHATHNVYGAYSPSIHMPKWAARDWLEVTEVRCQRIQDISNKDIRAEGAAVLGDVTHRLNMENLWNSTAKPEHQWGKNPWVFAYTFKRIDK